MHDNFFFSKIYSLCSLNKLRIVETDPFHFKCPVNYKRNGLNYSKKNINYAPPFNYN